MEGWCVMSVSNYGLLFAVCLMVYLFFHTIHISDYEAVQTKQTEYNLAVDEAVEAALFDAVESDSLRTISLNEAEVIHKFFQALYVNLGIMEQPMKKELCKFYVPYILFVENDGIVPYVQKDSGSDGLVSFETGRKYEYRWKGEKEDFLYVTLSDFVVYRNAIEGGHVEGYYQDIVEQLPDYFHWTNDEFKRRKQELIINMIKQCTNECIGHQNQIARKFGIQYEFTLPLIEYEEWYRTIQDISMLVLFQGYPFGNSITGTYNRVAIGGARIAKRKETATGNLP